MNIINPYRYAGEIPVVGNDTNAVLLLDMNGENGSTTFTNTAVGGISHTITANGSAQVKTNRKKWGTGSLCISSISDYLSFTDTDNSCDISGSSSWAIDTQIFPTGGATGDNIGLFNFGYGTSSQRVTFDFFPSTTGGNIRVVTQSNAVLWTESTNAWKMNGWNHIVFACDGTTARMYLNKNLIGSRTAFTVNYFSNIYIGRQSGNVSSLSPFYIDELRVSNTGRGYTGNTITLPTGPYIEAA